MPDPGIFEKAKKVRNLFDQVRASVIKTQVPGAFLIMKYTVDAFKVTDEGKEKYAQAMRLIHELHNGGPRGCFLALDILRDEREFLKMSGGLSAIHSHIVKIVLVYPGLCRNQGWKTR
jgi:hypothetical protein